MGSVLFNRVVAEAEKWGVSVTLVKDAEAIFAVAMEKNEGVYSAPANDAAILRTAHGNEHIVWATANRNTHGGQAATGLAHEVAHVIMGGNPSQHSRALEEGPMLAIEHELGTRLRLPWAKYMVLDGASWHQLGKTRQEKFLRNAYEYASLMGLMTSAGKPTYRRCDPAVRKNPPMPVFFF